jgi:superfamily II DNA or RNA helicase
MCARARPPVIRSVQTPDALASLRAWLDAFEPKTRKLGESTFATKLVKKIGTQADHYVEATVSEDEETFPVTLFLTRGQWTAKCACDLRKDCRHIYAAGLAWLADVEAGAPTGADPIGTPSTAAPIPVAPLVPAAPVNRHTFRVQWSPVLAEKIGRPLTEGEGRTVGNLAALFGDFARGSGKLHASQLRTHGFEYAPAPGHELHAPIFEDWWNPDEPPRDPWALWQYIAYHYEQTGREIPEVLKPLTDTTAVHAAVDDQLVQQELAVWREAFAAPETTGTAHSDNAATAIVGLRARMNPLGRFLIEVKPSADKPWRPPTQRWFTALAASRPADFASRPPTEAALASLLIAECRGYGWQYAPRLALTPDGAAALLATPAARDAMVRTDEQPFTVEAEPLVPEATVSAAQRDRLELHLRTPDGRSADEARLITKKPEPLYVFGGLIWRGPPPLPARHIPAAVLADAGLMSRLRASGLRLPAALEGRVRRVPLRPIIKCWSTADTEPDASEYFQAQLFARSGSPACEQVWDGEKGWQWTPGKAPAPRGADEPLLEFDLNGANAIAACFAEFRLIWNRWVNVWSRSMSKTFPEEFLAWRETLPPDLEIEASPMLEGLLGPALLAHVDFTTEAAPAGEGRDWFDLTVKLRVEDTRLKPDELALLLKARGKWVRLASHGWRRLEIAPAANQNTEAALDRLGLRAEDMLAAGKPTKHRLHALQLAAEADTFAAEDAALADTLRERAAALAALPTPPLPSGLRATLRPYQEEGFHFLAHLAARGFGGILADDMGLGKTVQTLAWLLHQSHAHAALAAANTGSDKKSKPFRALVICPKSVMHGWLTETERFAPEISAEAFTPLLSYAPRMPGPEDGPAILVVNYAQLRLNTDWFQRHSWDAVILDEAQFIKNPTSQTAAIARAIPAAHRIALTGTPIENRLLDLWSLFAFAQPGLLGSQAGFRRQFPVEDPTSPARLRRRVRHFMLRRTKAQVAPELPPRTEDVILVDLEGEQRLLYDAELKRARAQLLGIETARALDAVRFNVLASLLRLRQICCHPALVSDAHSEMPSAKLDALLERLEELRDEGQQVLVFSQFVSLLELIEPRLQAAGINYLMLTGATENRGELVEQFQSDRSKTVFLLSLKAAGSGLNLTAASYVILCDPWWNPAVEAQAIDRTHRIGQTQPVVAYRLVAADTVEQKILALQKDKAALANAVVQEESLASVLDLDSLRQILA